MIHWKWVKLCLPVWINTVKILLLSDIFNKLILAYYSNFLTVKREVTVKTSKIPYDSLFLSQLQVVQEIFVFAELRVKLLTASMLSKAVASLLSPDSYLFDH